MELKRRNESLPAGRWLLLATLLVILVSAAVQAVEPKDSGSYLDQKAFFKPELYISSSHVPVEEVLNGLPNRGAWEGYFAVREKALGPGQAAPRAFLDPRSGAATSVLDSVPLIPGHGAGNRVKLADLSKSLGRTVKRADAQAVGDAVLAYVLQHLDVLKIDPTQLGAVRAADVNPELWQVNIPQTYHGVPVRYGRLAATLNNGNLVVIGTETWGDVKGLSHIPKLSAADAMATGYAYIGGSSALDEIVRAPALEVIPVAQDSPGIGNGYRHVLVWSFVFRRAPDDAQWEVLVDAHSGEVLALQDINHYATEQITGGVYPLTNTEICPNNGQCGTMQTGWPLPFADTGLPAPNDFTSSAGLFNYSSGTVTTTLTGKYVDIVDSCGGVNESSATGSLGLGGSNGQHDCTTAGSSAGDTPAARTAFYEVNKLAEMARGWLPTNVWLQSRLTTNVNIALTCNAFWNGTSINFYRSGGGCRNTGEIAAVFDHEWGHGLDDNDAAGVLSNSSEGYADIASIFRLQASCVGHGFFWTSDKGCGQTSDGTGFNQNEAQQGASHCDLDCSGVRDADWDKHADHTPDTPLGFVCTSCSTGSGPCGRQVHCAAAPARQAAWDLVARDLRGAPFNLDSQTAFVVGNKLFYQGSGNIGAWHSCTCGSSASGCGATNGYLQWLAADDDNGNINDGTPHMTAIFNAFNRHGIACATPTPVDSGCAAGPSTAPAVTATPGDRQAALSWNSVGGATRYWVFRTEGHAGCDFGKTLIAEVTGTSYTDTQVANGRVYNYNVAAAGTSSACFSSLSNCAAVTPVAGPPQPDFTISCSPSSLSAAQGGSAGSTCTVTSVNSYSNAVGLSCTGQPAGVSCSFVPSSVTPPANGSAGSALTVNAAGTTAAGTYNFQVQGSDGTLTHGTNLSLTVTAVGCTLLPTGATCTANSQCCSNSCKGGRTKTCR